MNNPRDDAFSAEEQERLLRERAAALGDPSACEADALTLTPDIDPVVPAETCGDDDETLTSPFLPANPVPADPVPPSLLPDALVVVSREVEVACPEGQLALVGETPNVVAAGADTQLVYIDELDIPQAELFRLAGYIDDLQAYVGAELIGAIDGEDLESFDAGIVLITKTSLPVATLIRGALVAAQAVADEVAELIAISSLVCGWRSQEMWVVCQAEAPGYAVSFTEPEDVVSAYSPANLFESTVSQEDADEQAARAAALELACLVTNEEQDVTCSDAGREVDEAWEMSWPVNWTKAADARDAALGIEVVTLEAQGAGTWTVSDWDDFESNTETIELGDLNGQEFMQVNNVGASTRRRLRTRVIIEAGDPRTASTSLETANAIAFNLAVAELDCFVPNRPRIISCSTETYGSEEVRQRHLGLGLDMTNADRTTMFNELLGGSPATYGGPAYERTNFGVIDFGEDTEQEDRGTAYEVYVWPGYLSDTSVAGAEEQAGAYGAGFLQCGWVSPYHQCLCVSTPENAARQTVSSPTQVSSKFSTTTLADEDVLLVASGSTATSTIPRGLIVDTEYPNRVADPAYTAVTLSWPDLPALCQTSLSCLFSACKTVCCEPKPDDRPYKINGMPNYATWNNNWTLGEGRLSDQVAFMASWTEVRVNRRFSSCAGYSSGDDCDIPSIPSVGAANSIAAVGPSNGAYGMPARFKYGGTLRWGNQWAEAVPVDPDSPTSATLQLIGRIKSCHKDEAFTQQPDIWGIYSCAEGYAESFSPVGLGEVARQNALGRLDCTHINWPRHLSSCPEPNQKRFGPSTNLNVVIEANSTREANEQFERLLLPLMHCRDTHNFMLNFSGVGGEAKLEIPAPSVVNGGVTTCIPQGVNQLKLYEDDCETEVDLSALEANASAHVFILVRCCKDTSEDPPDPPEKRLILNILPDPAINGEMAALGQQLDGQLGLPSGRAALATLRLVEESVWYIGSFSVRDLGLGASAWLAERSVVQVHSGPIPLSSTCCPGDYLPWDLKRGSEMGMVRVHVGSILKNDDDDVQEVLTCANPDEDFTPNPTDILYIEISELLPTEYSLVLGAWPLADGKVVDYTGTVAVGDFTFVKRYYPLWRFDALASAETVEIWDGMPAVKVAPSTHLAVVQKLWKSDESEYVPLPALAPAGRSI